MARVIGIVSGKGGVGKTTLVSNLAYTLTELGKDVTAIDTNLTTPHLGLHLGLHSTSKSLHDYLRGDARLHDVIYYHPYGFKVVPASLSVNDLIGVNSDRVQDLMLNLLGRTDFILVDSAPSLGKEALTGIQVSDEVLLLSNPNLPSVLDALKVGRVAEKMNKIILGMVVNRVDKKENELSLGEIEEITKYPVVSVIPEDVAVQRALAARKPIVDYSPKSQSAVEMRALGHYIVGREFKYPKEGFLQRIVNWLW